MTKALGFDLSDAESAIAGFVSLITADGPAGDTARGRLYSAGLAPDLIYGLKNNRQRKLGAGKLVAALVACEDLKVIVEGKATADSPAPRWVVRAEAEKTSLREQADDDSGHSPEGIAANTSRSLWLDREAEIQLSLFSRFESPESTEIDIRDVRLSRKEPHQADLRMDLVLRRRQAN